MNIIKAPFSLRLKNSLQGIKRTFNNPIYIFIAVLVSFLVTGFVIWALNIDLLRFVLFESGFPQSTKVQILWDVQTGIYGAYNNIQATGIILFGMLFGINMAMIVKAVRLNIFRQIPKKSGSASLVVAIVSGGCVACGTSILAPILATAGATASVTIQEISNILNWLSIVLILYSIFTLGQVINNLKVMTN